MQDKNKKGKKMPESETIPTYDFDFDKIMNFCNKIDSLSDQVKYLLNLLKIIDSYKFDGKEEFEGDEIEPRFRAGRTRHDILSELEDRKKRLDYEKMIGHKTGFKNVIENKIQWQGSETQLIYLFELLFKSNLIPLKLYDKRFALIADHFLNKNGENFKNTQLAQSSLNYRNSVKGKPKNSNNIENLIKTIKDI